MLIYDNILEQSIKKEKGFMDIASILGLALATIIIVVAYLMDGGQIAGLLQPTAAMIVFGGTIGAVMASFPLKDLMNVPALLKIVYTEKQYNPIDIINKLAELSEKARKEGLLSLEGEAQTSGNEVVKKGLALVVDGIETDVIKDILIRETHLLESIYIQGAKIFQSAGGYSPTMGIIGTVMGLISVLSTLEDASKLGEKIALAFVATLYGVFFANLVWLPFENKIKVKAQKEKMINDIIIEGLLSIQAGENPRIIKEKLNLSLYEKMEKKDSSAQDASAGAEG